jgi:hypothetical protein
VWLIIAALAMLEPLAHLWIAYGLPAGSTPTGLHIPDTICFRVFMDAFESDFRLPHATCQAPGGTNFIGYFAMPYTWLYCILGAVGHILRLDDFLLLGFANGAVGAIYLWVVYRFLKRAVPAYANLAFAFFTLGGGLGGVLYVFTGLLGLHGAPSFEENFARYALYELIEGPCLSPVLHFPRLYYCVGLALCYGGLIVLMNACRKYDFRRACVLALVMFSASFLHSRFGPLTWLVGMFYLYAQEDVARGTRMRLAGVLTGATFLGVGASMGLMTFNPSFVGSTVSTVRQAMWLFPFLSAAFFFLFLVPCEVGCTMRCLPRFGRACCWCAVGYLAAFVLLYLAHQVYWGNYLKGGEPEAALFSSDKALAGALVGFIFGLTRRTRDRKPDAEMGWVTLWFLAFLCFAVSAWGNGVILGLSPQRAMAMLGVPLALLAARRVHSLRLLHPKIAAGIVAVIVACGITSVVVGATCFQGPLFHKPGKRAFAWHHVESMTPNDAEVLTYLRPGVVLSTKQLNDVIALRPGNQVIFGAATGLGDQGYETMEEGVGQFFSADATPEFRADYLGRWCIDFVFCPDTYPVASETVEQLYRMIELAVVVEAGNAVLFQTQDPADTTR